MQTIDGSGELLLRHSVRACAGSAAVVVPLRFQNEKGKKEHNGPPVFHRVILRCYIVFALAGITSAFLSLALFAVLLLV
jgi:hypothetical protein